MSSGALARVPGLQELLDQCQRRIRVHSLLRGSAETLCVLIAAVMFGCLLDYLIALPGAVRFALLAMTLLLTSAVAWKRLVTPLLTDAPRDELGAAVDLQFPELQESLATLISIEGPNATSGESGSILMRQRLQQYVTVQISDIRPAEVVRSRTTVQRVLLAVASIVAVMIPVLLWPSGSRLLAQRFAMPFANLAAPSNLFFEIRNGNRVAATNSTVLFAAIPRWRTEKAGSLPTNVVLEMQGVSGGIEVLPMLFDESETQYLVTLADVRQSLRYRVRGGGAQTEWFTLTVADRPRITSAVLHETPPAYTGRPVEVFDGVVGDITVFERSAIEMTLTFNKPVERVNIQWKNWNPIEIRQNPASLEELIPGQNEGLLPEEIAAGALNPVRRSTIDPPSEPAFVSPDGRAATFRFEAMGSGEFEFVVEDALGLTNSNETTRRLIVTTDTPPQLTVTGIADGLEVRPDDNVPLDCAVTDDIGVGLLELHFRKNSDATRIQPAVPFDRGARIISHAFRLDLKTLQVKSGDTVTFRVRAADERPEPGPQVVWKGPWTIRISDDAESLGQKPLREADQQLIDALRKLEEQLQQDAQKAGELKSQADRQWDGTAQEEIRSLSEKEQKQGRELQQLAEQVAQHPLMRKPSLTLSELAQQLRQNIPQKLDEAAAMNRDGASRNLQESTADLNRVREELHKVTDEIQQVAQLEQELAELNRLALEAEQLARDSQKLQEQRAANQPDEGQSLEEHRQQMAQQQQQLQQEQQRLTADLSSLLQRKQELLQAARESQLDQVAEVAEQAKRLAEQQQRLAEGVQEEARDAARDAQQIANQLQEARNQAEQLGQQIQQHAPDIQRPDVQPLDDAIRDLRQGNLATPQKGIERVQQQLAEVSQKLAQPGEQNEKRRDHGEQADQINQRLKQLEKQLAKMADDLGAKSAQQPSKSQEPANGETTQQAENQAAQKSDSRSSSDSADTGRNLMAQLAKMADAAEEQSRAVSADSKANSSAKQHAEQAAQRADDAMRYAQAGQFNRSAEQMRNTAKESTNAASQLPDPAQQDRNAQLQQQADNFNRMSETVQRLQEDSAAQVATQQESQQNVAQSARELPEPLNGLAERLNLPALGMQHLARPAEEAANAAQQAATAGQQAADQLDQTQLQQAGQSAQESAGHLNRAAQLAQQAAQGRRDPNAVIPTEVGESVTDALHSLQKASELMDQETARLQNEQAGQQPSDVPSGQQPGDLSGDGQSGDAGQQPGEQAGEPSPNGQPGGESQQGEGQPGDGKPGQGQPGAGQPGAVKSGLGQPGASKGTPQKSSAQQMANVAKALQNAAKGALPNQFSPGQLNSDGSTASSDPQGQGNPAEFDGQIPEVTRRKGKGRLWGQLQDELGNNVGDAGKEVLDNEYSELIRRYRRDLARSADQDTTKKTNPPK
jgi:hypothetical protein